MTAGNIIDAKVRLYFMDGGGHIVELALTRNAGTLTPCAQSKRGIIRPQAQPFSFEIDCVGTSSGLYK